MDYKDPSELTAGFALLEPGECTFVVKNVFYKDKEGHDLKSGAGEPKVIVIVEATDVNGTQSSIYEHITAKATFKAYTIAKAVGRKEVYEPDGTDFDALKGLSGKCIVKTKSSPGYNDKSEVSTYMAHSKYKDELPSNVVAGPNAAKVKEEMVEIEDSQIPF